MSKYQEMVDEALTKSRYISAESQAIDGVKYALLALAEAIREGHADTKRRHQEMLVAMKMASQVKEKQFQ